MQHIQKIILSILKKKLYKKNGGNKFLTYAKTNEKLDSLVKDIREKKSRYYTYVCKLC